MSQGRLSSEEFAEMSKDRKVLEMWGRIGVEPHHFQALASVLFQDEARPGTERSISLNELVLTIIDLRPDKTAAAIDVKSSRFILRSDVDYAHNYRIKQLRAIRRGQEKLAEAIDACRKAVKRLDARAARVEARLDR